MSPLFGLRVTVNQCALEAIAVGARVNDVGAVGDAVQQRLAQASGYPLKAGQFKAISGKKLTCLTAKWSIAVPPFSKEG